jgi:hypothetical protein
MQPRTDAAPKQHEHFRGESTLLEGQQTYTHRHPTKLRLSLMSSSKLEKEDLMLPVNPSFEERVETDDNQNPFLMPYQNC